MSIIPTLSDLPAAPRRIVLHWTAGGHRVNSVDLAAYHYIVEGDGRVREGRAVAENMRSIQSGPYAAHTRSLNSFSVGISLAGMTGALENGPYGPAPLTRVQMDSAVRFLARCCREWGLEPWRREHLLTHAEVPDVYGIAQPGKWDITVLPFEPSIRGARAVGDYIRDRVAMAMTEAPDLPDPVVRVEDSTAGLRVPPPKLPERMDILLTRPVADVALPDETAAGFLQRVGGAAGDVLGPIARILWDRLLAMILARLEREADKVADRVFPLTGD